MSVLEKELTEATCSRYLVYLEQHRLSASKLRWQDFVLLSDSAVFTARHLSNVDAHWWLGGPAALVQRWAAAESVIRGQQQRMHLTRD